MSIVCFFYFYFLLSLPIKTHDHLLYRTFLLNSQEAFDRCTLRDSCWGYGDTNSNKFSTQIPSTSFVARHSMSLNFWFYISIFCCFFFSSRKTVYFVTVSNCTHTHTVLVDVVGNTAKKTTLVKLKMYLHTSASVKQLSHSEYGHVFLYT